VRSSRQNERIKSRYSKPVGIIYRRRVYNGVRKIGHSSGILGVQKCKGQGYTEV